MISYIHFVSDVITSGPVCVGKSW